MIPRRLFMINSSYVLSSERDKEVNERIHKTAAVDNYYVYLIFSHWLAITFDQTRQTGDQSATGRLQHPYLNE